ncbi:TetR/AcrR family transcriptional regulator [Aeromicrobium yanjiei]|uniref:TetR family transcriptional regulator n=1 Tax=Aeromicrobium yanjiei TaxID=2662028 RepID=A0A5Q2MNA1_9ACTN|nr:TetR/AcrR family transcriptional regulator [Aeromicrobium yanjiei]QGG42622.1 TetR family transcriptional regulator [Aeromicrobium yanjiei]
MTEPVKTRPYRSALRAERSERTREAVLDAARDLFTTTGYAGTTVRAIADRAGVNPDTLYAAVGRKPQIMLALVESALSGQSEPVSAQERDYVKAIRQAERATEMIDLYAAAITAIQVRLAPIHAALQVAALTDSHCADVWRQVAERRAANMMLLAQDLRATGELRGDLSDRRVADVIWSMNAAEYWDLLVVQRGWSPEELRTWLADAWKRLLLSDQTTAAASREGQRGPS